MSRTRKSKQIEEALKKKGFKKDNTHHKVYFFYVKDKKTGIRTFVSHGIKEYSGNLLSKVRNQMKLSTNRDFDDFMDCSMTETQYRDKLINGGHITI